MYFRFFVALAVVVAVALVGVAIERENLRLKQQISRQHFRMDVLDEKLADVRAETQRLGTPERLLESLEEGRIVLAPTDAPAQVARERDRNRH